MSKLWYRSPATQWEEALPLGNGRIGAMVFGNPYKERIQLNEESIWYGGLMDRNNKDAKEALPKVRKLIFDGRIKEAEKLLKYAFSGTPESMRPYQTLGDIFIDFEGINNIDEYYRELDVNTAVYKQNFKDGEKTYSRQIFISKPADAMIMYLKAEGGAKLNFTAMMRRERFFDGVKKSNDHSISLYGNLGKDGFDYMMSLSAKVKDGRAFVVGENLIVENATEALLYFTVSTTYRISDKEKLEETNLSVLAEAEKTVYSTLVKDHLDDYQSLFGRMEFTLNSTKDYDSEPTDVRLKTASTYKKADPFLSKLYFDYGRYLLISCSRKGGLPATLQGLWNQDMLPPWDSKYTININTEMNYWPAESCNLSECHEPLFELIKKMVPNGRVTAQTMYGCRGFVAHHNTDMFGDTAVQDIWNPGSYWVMGAAWLCTHLWTHYQYTKDRAFLEEYFPIMREAALFFLDFLVEHNDYLVTCPSVSPENTFILNNGQQGANTYGCTMDNQILRDLFSQCNEAAAVLGIDDELNDSIKKACERLIPTQIGIGGNILEWPYDYEELEPGHRHISHLYGLFPSEQITLEKTPELAQAAKVTLEKRLSAGGGHTGWSRAWIINHYTRLRDRDKAYENLLELFKSSTYPNLFDKHPPFQIDGNFGATAAMVSMIIQSFSDRIILLPTVPKAWKEGSMNGIRLKGNGQADISWKNGKLTEVTFVFNSDYSTEVTYLDNSEKVDFKANEPRTFKANMLGKLKEIVVE